MIRNFHKHALVLVLNYLLLIQNAFLECVEGAYHTEGFCLRFENPKIENKIITFSNMNCYLNEAGATRCFLNKFNKQQNTKI